MPVPDWLGPATDLLKEYGLDDAAAWVEAKARPWIRVEDGLPRPDTNVLVSYMDISDHADVDVGMMNRVGVWFCYSTSFEERVFAWQSLPEPYRPEES